VCFKHALALFLASLTGAATALAQPSFMNLTMAGSGPRLTILGAVGTTNQILSVTNLNNNWAVLTSLVVTQCPYTFTDNLSAPGRQRFYRVVDPSFPTNPPPAGMALIPAGAFQMGDTFNEGAADELPVHPVYVSAFYMSQYETTLALWDKVLAWSQTNGYTYDYPGTNTAPNEPVLDIDWYDMVKWCNARSQMEGRAPAYYTDTNLTQIYTSGDLAPYVNWNAGYRLPTEAEWEKAARGGLSGLRFPWGNTISQTQANYYADPGGYSYDVNPNSGYDPAYNTGEPPYIYTSPVGSFAPNGYGLYDMAGNAWEWCWDWAGLYASGFQSDPRGPSSSSSGRVGRGGNWNYYAEHCRNSYRYGNSPGYLASNIGFRCALPVP
jgi:formylglycine-generating enzyme required for sulfatase activity